MAPRIVVLSSLVLFALTGASKPATQRVISGNGMVDGQVNGVAARYRIDPAGGGAPLLTTSIAERAKLSAGFFKFGFTLGGQKVGLRTAVTRIDFGSGSIRRRVAWSDRAYARGVDVLIGPGGLPEPIVRFALRPSMPGERTMVLKMVDGGGLFGSAFGLFALIDVGGAPLRVRFDPFHARTLVTANAAVRLAQANGGRVAGTPQPVEIVFGIARPVRALVLQRPVIVGPLSFTTMGVRTGDYGSTSSIPDRDLDPDEIVVVGKVRPDPRRDRLTIGADLLDTCSSIVYDKPAKQIRLTCA